MDPFIYRECRATISARIPDTPDADAHPDRVLVQGRGTAHPQYQGGSVVFTEIGEYAIPQPIPVVIVDGELLVEVLAGDESVETQPLFLPVTVDERANQNWSWRLTFDFLTLGEYGEEVNHPPLSFPVEAGDGPLEISTVATPVIKSQGFVTRGAPGAGLQDITAADGEIVFSWDNGRTTAIDVPAAVPGPEGPPGSVELTGVVPSISVGTDYVDVGGRDVQWYRGGLNASFPVNGPLGSLKDGDYRVTTDTTASALGLPGGQGNLKQLSYGTFGMQIYTSLFQGTATRIWRAGHDEWGAWVNSERAYTDQVTDEITWFHGGLAATTPINGPLGSIRDGEYRVSTDSRAAELGITGGGAGKFTQISYAEFGIHINTSLTGTVARIWKSDTNEWGDWVPHGGSSGPTTVTASASGTKRVPLALTLGHGGGANPATSGTVRIPLHYAAPISRWRLHVRNINPREGIRDLFTGSVSLPQGLWVGTDEGNGQAGNLVQVAPPATTPENGDEWVSDWITHELPAGSQHLLSFAYEASDQVVRNAGGMWTTSGHVADSTTATWVKELMGPLDLWIEAETPSTTPVVAVIGDSLSVGSASDLPIHDSTLSQHMRAWGGLPIHYAHVGDTLHSWNGYGANFSEDYKKERWLDLARPDSVLFALGSNDIFGYSKATLETMQGRFEGLLEWVRTALSDNVFFATITPRTADETAQEQVRRDYNAWLAGRSDTRQLFDFAAAISDDDETILPPYDGDGVHLTTAGYAAQAAILHDLSSSGEGRGVAELRERVDASERKTGWRKIALTEGWSGDVYAKREGQSVSVLFNGVRNVTENPQMIVLAPGFTADTPPGTSERFLLHNTSSAGRRGWVTGNSLSVAQYQPDEALYGSAKWDTSDPWPPTLPGTPA